MQERGTADHELIAEVISWFDLVALQEVNDNLAGIRGVLDQLPSNWRMQFSDAGGNRERAAFLYDTAQGRAAREDRPALDPAVRPRPDHR